MAVGLVEAVFGKDVTSEETKCRRRGDGACVFVLKSKDGGPLSRLKQMA
jgi:predicted hydrocarbon binding protein